MKEMIGTFIVLAILVVVICLVVRSMIKDKKNGKSLQCGVDCKNCNGCLLLLGGFFISWIIALLKSVMERKEI